MDWANQPDPFRRFAGARTVELPLVAGPHDLPFESLTRPGAVPPVPLDPVSLGLFLELALGLTAWKQIHDTRWALRSNPSSGNLHPSEGYLLLPPIDGVSKHAGVYHYAVSEHALEERCALADSFWNSLTGSASPPVFLVALSSIHWREAWKYGERAYRYCQHDAGHALGSLRYAAAVLGWNLRLCTEPSDADLSVLLGLHRTNDFTEAESEFPDFLAVVSTSPDAQTDVRLSESLLKSVADGEWQGKANRLSPEHVNWPEIASIEVNAVKTGTTRLCRTSATKTDRDSSTKLASSNGSLPATAIIRRRRSAVAMDGQTPIARNTLVSMLSRTMPHRNAVPWDSFPFPPRIALFVFVHRVRDLPPGLYVLLRDAETLQALRSACRNDFTWRQVSGCELPLYELATGDFRRTASFVACGQDIAGDGAFSLGMIADFSRTLHEEGTWAYRRLFWEAGLIGQVLYLEAEAAGTGATGIGCYFDDLMHEILGLDLAEDAWQSLYHFTVGRAVEDTRLTILPPYFHIARS